MICWRLSMRRSIMDLCGKIAQKRLGTTCKTNFLFFVEDESKRLDSAPEGSPNHVLIEGDNLNALAALTYAYAGKIDVIYIDPPYNTGNKDFIYNDSFVEPVGGIKKPPEN